MSNKLRSIKKGAPANADGVKVTIEELLASRGPLQVLLTQPLPARLAFRLTKLAKAVTAELETYEETRKALCERYADKDDDGRPKKIGEGSEERFDIPEAKMPELEAEHKDLLQSEVTIAGQRIKLNDISGISIAPAHLISLAWLVEE